MTKPPASPLSSPPPKTALCEVQQKMEQIDRQRPRPREDDCPRSRDHTASGWRVCHRRHAEAEAGHSNTPDEHRLMVAHLRRQHGVANRLVAAAAGMIVSHLRCCSRPPRPPPLRDFGGSLARKDEHGQDRDEGVPQRDEEPVPSQPVQKSLAWWTTVNEPSPAVWKRNQCGATLSDGRKNKLKICLSCMGANECDEHQPCRPPGPVE